MLPLVLTHYTATTCFGQGKKPLWQAILSQTSGLRPCNFEDVEMRTFLGEVAGVNEVELPARLSNYNCRNNRLAFLGLQADGFENAVKQAMVRYGANRVGLLLGTSSSGLFETELAYRHRDRQSANLPATFCYREAHNTYSVADFVQNYFDLKGPSSVVSTACSSSAKVFAMAQRWIAAGVVDAVVVGGVDSLCLSTIYGFRSLELIAEQPCRPFDQNRSGLSLGEASAFALLEKSSAQAEADDANIFFLGYGEASDAYHMSAPHPDGLGAQMAMRDALARANLNPSQIDYINLHGTATPSNDAAEGKAVSGVFGVYQVTCSSTKGATGHALGAAGAVEAVICALALHHQIKPAGVNTQIIDPTTPLNYLLNNGDDPLKYVLSNSFGFGGSNCSLVFGVDA